MLSDLSRCGLVVAELTRCGVLAQKPAQISFANPSFEIHSSKPPLFFLPGMNNLAQKHIASSPLKFQHYRITDNHSAARLHSNGVAKNWLADKSSGKRPFRP